jgi:hypothetical protein
MSDVFFSYKSEDRDKIERIVRELQADGFDIWWDREIPAGKTYRQVIQDAISEAKVVIVAWSKHTEDSGSAGWVYGEVDEAKRQAKGLLPVLLEACTVPMEYRAIQAVDLSAWNGGRNSPQWKKLTDGLHLALQSSPAAETRPQGFTAPPVRRPAPSNLPLIIGGAVAAIALIGAAVYFVPKLFAPPPAPTIEFARAMPEPRPADAIGEGLARAAQTFQSSGAQLVGVLRGNLAASATESLTIPLIGAPQSIIAFCDQGCGDIDSRLFNAEGGEIESDTGTDSEPLVHAPAATAPDQYARLDIIMYQCQFENCAYAAAVYADPSQITDVPGRPEVYTDAPPLSVPAAEAAEVIHTTLDDGAATLPKERIVALFQPAFSALQQKWRARTTLTLDAGVEYRFFGACDQECTDLDMYVRSADESSVAEDTGTEKPPVIGFTPTVTGPYFLDVVMFGCNEGHDCRFGVSGYRFKPRR